MIRRPPRSTRTDTLFPCTTLFRSAWKASIEYTNLLGTTTGFGLRALYSAPSEEPVTVIEDTILQPFEGENGDLAVSTPVGRSEEHTSELQSLMRISYAVFCLKNNTLQITNINRRITYIHTLY